MDYRKPTPELYNVPWAATDYKGMPYVYLGKSGLKVSKVGLGTWKIGFPETGDGSRVDEKKALAIFDRAAELGVTFWDTANRYNNASGNSEKIIGEWFRSNPNERRNIVIATKMFGGMDGFTPNHSGLSRTNIIASVDASLKRMGLDYIDVLYFHGYDEERPCEESLAAVEDLIKADKVRYFAVSNFTVDQLKLYEAARIGSFSIRSRICAVQNQFNIVQGEADIRPGVLEYAAETGISFIAWSPFGEGLLTGRYQDKGKVGAGDRLFDQDQMEICQNETVMNKISALSDLAKKISIPMPELVLAYMFTLPGMGPAIPAVSSIAQLESNAHAAVIKLDDATIKEIETILQ